MNAIYLRNVRTWPAHWQAAFEEMRISMGVREAYFAIKAMRGGAYHA